MILLSDLYAQLSALTVRERDAPAMYHSADTLGPVDGIGPLQRPVLLAVSGEDGPPTELPVGFPVLKLRQSDFRPAEGKKPPPQLRLPEQYRVTDATLAPGGQHHRALGPAATQWSAPQQESPNGGLFLLPRPGMRTGAYFLVLADNGLGHGGRPGSLWEHVSISLRENVHKRVPTWEEMSYARDLFWPPDAAVVQLHPPRSQYVNLAPYTLHLWRSLLQQQLLPPPALVGPVTG